MKRFVILQPGLHPRDPHTCTDANEVRNWRFALYEPLVEPDGEYFAPVLAESWGCSDDARTWTFVLREGVRFHDDRLLTVRDVIYSLKRAAGPMVTGELFTVTFHHHLAGLEFEAVDERTIRLRLPEPVADLLELLCNLVVIPEGALTDRILDGNDANSGGQLPPGSGPYRLESFDPGGALLHSWERHRRGERKQPVVEFRGVPEEQARLAALRGGRADLVTRLSPESAGVVEEGEGAALFSVESNVCVVYLMNLKTECLADVRARQALNHAADKQSIIREILLGQGGELNGPLSSLHFGYAPEVPAYCFDQRRARSLAEQAGLQEVVLHTPLDLPAEAPRVTGMLAEQFRAVGIDSRIECHQDRLEYARSIAEKRFEGLFCFDSSPLSTFRVLREKLDSRFHGPWWQGYHNDQANLLLSRAAATADPAARRLLYRRACRIYRDEAPWLFLYQPRRLWGIRHSARSVVRANREGVLRFR